MKNERIMITAMLIVILMNIYISIKSSSGEPMTDFSAFYYAANVVLDKNVPDIEVYNLNTMLTVSDSYGISDLPMPFVYSLASAYIISPIALIPYKEAKFVWSLLGLMFYLGAMIICLRVGDVSKLWFIGGIALLLLWMPFVYSQIWLQTNPLLIFLVALAVLAAVKNRPLASGLLIGIASLFKLFPLAFAAYLGLKNWRIAIACFAMFIISFLIPGSMEWFHEIQIVHSLGESGINTPVYTWLSQYGYIWFFVYAVVVTGITVLIIYLNKSADYLVLISFAIPATFLVNPYVDYHHLTMLALSYSYILSRVEILTRWFLVLSIMSFAFVAAAVFYFPYVNPISPIVMIGVFLLWINFSILFLSKSNYIYS